MFLANAGARSLAPSFMIGFLLRLSTLIYAIKQVDGFKGLGISFYKQVANNSVSLLLILQSLKFNICSSGFDKKKIRTGHHGSFLLSISFSLKLFPAMLPPPRLR